MHGSNWYAWKAVEVYNPATDTWTTNAEMPVMRAGAGIAVLGGRIYVMGGFAGQQPSASVEEYDPTNDSWRTLPTGLLSAREFRCGAVVSENLYMIGGEFRQ